MFKLIKKLFFRQKKELSENLKIETIPTKQLRSHEKSPKIYWQFWINKNQSDFANRIEKAKWILSQSIEQYNGRYIMQGSNGAKYTVTLTNCTCPDFQKRKYSPYDYPCKHMCRLAINKNIINVTVHTQEEVEQKAKFESEEKQKLSKCQLSEDKIYEILNLINNPDLIPLEVKNNINYFDSNSFYKKEERYEEKLSKLLDEISEQYKVEKIIPLVNKLQLILVSFKEFCYEYGEYGKDEYECLHGSDFIDTKNELESILHNYFPENLLSYREEAELKKTRNNDKLLILTTIGNASIPQATVIKQLFPSQKTYGQKLCLELIDEGKLTRSKQGNKYILTAIK